MKILINGEINEDSLVKKTGIFLSGLNFSPPHLSLVINGQYYSCSANSVKSNLSFRKIFNKLKRRKYLMIFCELNFPISLNKAKDNFQNYGILDGNKTCLGPVKKTIESELKLNIHADFIFELLPFLEAKNLVNNYFHYGLNDHIHDNYFQLQKYSKDEIISCIRELQFLDAK